MGRGLRIGHSQTPSWVSALTVGQIAQISGTTVPANLDDFCGVGVREEAGRVEIMHGAVGGHGGNLTDNTVRSIRMEADAPAWSVLRSASSSTGWDTTGETTRYLPDNRPAPSHTYWNTHWVPEISRLVHFAAYYVGSGAAQYLDVDAFDPAAGDWDAPGTWPDLPNTYYVAARNPSTGVLYALQGANVLAVDPSDLSTSLTALSGGTAQRGGQAYDTARDRIYHLCSGDNFSAGSSTITSILCNPATGACQTIAFNSSSAYTDFQSAASGFLTTALVYDADDDCYYFYNGGAEGTQKIWRIKPNGTTAWDMTLLSVTGLTPGASGGGVMNKLIYVSRWRVLLLLVPGENIYALALPAV